MERIELHPGYSISRVIKGGWHLAGGHGAIDRRQAIQDMRSFVEVGITTFDCADIYTGVEELIGQFIKETRGEITSGEIPSIQIHTKYVPDHDVLGTLTREDTARVIERSLVRLGVERLDLVQFAWWDYNYPNYVETALHLVELQKQGKIRHLGVTNFNASRLGEMIEAGLSIVSNQVQYSLLDHRPENDLLVQAEKHDIPFLCYGTLAGGFLSDRYLNAPDPVEPLENRSLTKYRLIIDEFGGYELFQEALRSLRKIADKFVVSISEVASRFMLQKPKVAGVIIGARNKNHLDSLQKLNGFSLDNQDMTTLNNIVKNAHGPKGPVYDLERNREGKHGAIMRYNLNEPRT